MIISRFYFVSIFFPFACPTPIFVDFVLVFCQYSVFSFVNIYLICMDKTYEQGSAKVTITLPCIVLETIDSIRKDVSRSRFVLRLLEKNIYNGGEF